ncbi:MAG TPA: metal-dependent hydrolase [Mariprofundaceae bacterium]|nr:metal-dependent hydrolase [Mariprofundaceae bacterium]
MDPLTHALSGYAIARAVPKQAIPKRQVALIVLLAMAPDLDYVLSLVSDTVYLHYHRGVTHSLLMLPLWTWLIYSLMPARRDKQPLMPWLIAAALAMHILLDLITSFGTMIFAPLSDYRYSFDLVYIIDLLFTGILGLPLLIALFWRRLARPLAILGLAGMSGYLLLTITTHEKALSIARQQQPNAQEVYSLPQPFSPFRWHLIARYPDNYRQAIVNLWPGFNGSSLLFPKGFVQRYTAAVRPASRLTWQQMPRMHTYAGLEELPGVHFYRWFARFPVVLKRHGERPEFGDLRFGAGLYPDSPFRLLVDRQQERAWIIWRDHRSPITTRDDKVTENRSWQP